jgi:hypothetical protein
VDNSAIALCSEKNANSSLFSLSKKKNRSVCLFKNVSCILQKTIKETKFDDKSGGQKNAKEREKRGGIK